MTSPSEPSALIAATNWLSDVMLGGVALAVATIAIAMVGILMLSGRIDWRRGVTVVVGCFILFGARSIANGLMGIAGDRQPAAYVTPAEPPPPQPTVLARPYDPYAGATPSD